MSRMLHPDTRQKPKVRPTWPQVVCFAALGPLLLAIVAVWLGTEYRRAEHNRAEAQQSYEHRRDVGRLFSLMQDAETGQRGYIISGQKIFLEPYVNARANLRPQLARVRQAMDGVDSKLARLQRLEALIDAKFAEMQALIELRDRQGAGSASQQLAVGRGKRLMDDIRATVSEMGQAEDAELAAILAEDAEQTAVTQRIIWLGIGIIGMLACLLGYLVGHGWRLHNQGMSEREEASARQRAIFERSTDAIILVNPSGSIEIINPAAERMFGYRTEDLLRRDISTLVDIAPGDAPFLDRLGLVNGELSKTEFIDLTGRTREGEAVHLDVVLGTMPLPDGVHIVAALRDAAGRKEVERLKDDFISTVSHELRTPLTSVVGSLSLLRSGAAGDLPPAAQRLAEIAENNCQRLIRLINDILDMDQLETGRMAFDYEVIDLRDVARRAAQAMQGLADRKAIKITPQVPDHALVICADAERLVQVATNLLSNAIQFSPEGSTITVEAHEGDRRHDLQIVDQGPGISDDFARRIFARFSQGSRPDAEIVSGSGLGLAISREIVRQHDGDIWFENVSEGTGARFAFSIPRHPPERSQSRQGLHRMLICEDDADAGMTVRSMLTAHGFASDLVTTVRDGAALARLNRYSAILLDLTLADADGLEVIRSINADTTMSGPPVIVISGAAESHSLRQSEPNIIDWVRKPFDTPRLMLAIDRALAKLDRERPTILHIDDDDDTLELFAAAMAGRARIVMAKSLASAGNLLMNVTPDLVVLDLGLPDGNGVALLPRLVDGAGMHYPIVIYSAQEVDADVRGNVDAVLVKSRRSLPDLVSTVSAILDGKLEPVVEAVA